MGLKNIGTGYAGCGVGIGAAGKGSSGIAQRNLSALLWPCKKGYGSKRLERACGLANCSNKRLRFTGFN